MPELSLATPPADPRHPDVPLGRGVPKLASHSPANDSALKTQDGPEAAALATQEWGVYDDGGALVLDPDNILSVGSGVDYRIADYSMEAGEFGTYNKVAMPFEVKVAMTKGGSLADRTAFLDTLAHLKAGLDLLSVVTPTITHLSVNIIHTEQDQSVDSGAGLTRVMVTLREIRETGTIEFAEDDTGDTVGGLGAASGALGVPKTTPSSPTPAPKKPSVKTPRSPAAVRKRSSGAAQPRPTTKTDDAALARAGFSKQRDGSFVYTFTAAERARANRPL